MNVGLALGVVIVRLALWAGGPRAAFIAPAVAGLVLAVALWRPVHRIDATATVPQVEIALLRSIPIFSGLGAPSIEALARRLAPVEVRAGTTLMREGDAGDRYYAVAEGRVSVSRQGRTLAQLSHGQGFGEIALVHDVPRTATVTADTDTRLFALDKQDFVLALARHPAMGQEARAVASRHLRAQEADPPP
jgi:hypothetical protein